MTKSTSSSASSVLLPALKEALQSWLPVVQRAAGGLVGVFVFLLTFEAIAYFFTSSGLTDQQNAATLEFRARLLLGISELLMSLILVVLIPIRLNDLRAQALDPTPFWPTLKDNLIPLILESLRAAAFILLWSLLLIIPGLVKQVRYSLFPYIVIFDPEYKAGRVDAIGHSDQLIKGLTLPLFFIWLAELGLILGIESLAEALATSPISWLLLTAASRVLTLSLSIYTYCLFYTVYLKRTAQTIEGDADGVDI